MATTQPAHLALRRLLTDFAAFSRACYPQHALRQYQLEAALPILDALEARRTRTRPVLSSGIQNSEFIIQNSFCLLMARQAGKDELLAQLQAFVLARQARQGGGIVLA